MPNLTSTIYTADITDFYVYYGKFPADDKKLCSNKISILKIIFAIYRRKVTQERNVNTNLHTVPYGIIGPK